MAEATTALITIDPAFEFEGVIYDIRVHRVRPLSDKPRDAGSFLQIKRTLILYQCVNCGLIIQPLGKAYCDDACKDHFHRWERKKR